MLTAPSAEFADRTIASILDLLGVAMVEQFKDYKFWSLPPTKVLITANDKYIDSQNSQSSLSIVINVLCRLFPIITHLDISLDGDAPVLACIPLIKSKLLKKALRQSIKRINSPCQVAFIDQPREGYDAILSIGPSDIQSDFKVTAYSDGWLACISRDYRELPPPSENVNPIGAYTAGLLGCIEVFKIAFKNKLHALFPHEAKLCYALQRMRFISSELRFSTFNYSVDASLTENNPELPSSVDIDEMYLIGLGAIGQAVIYALGSLPTEGTIHLVDPDEVRWSNINRYISATKDDAEVKIHKVKVAERILKARQDKLKVKAYPKSYDEFRSLSQNRRYDLLISAVDNNETRRLIQHDLPKVILNAGTLESMYSISRVELGQSQCLICPDPRGGHEYDLLNIIASMTGISVKEIERLRRTNNFFEEEHIQRLLKHVKGSPTFPIPHLGTRFSDWLHEHKSELGLAKSPELNIPIPLTNILAGILLAGEAIKDKHFYEHRLNSQFDHDIFCLPMSELHRLIPSSPVCPFCANKNVLQRFRNKYSNLSFSLNVLGEKEVL